MKKYPRIDLCCQSRRKGNRFQSYFDVKSVSLTEEPSILCGLGLFIYSSTVTYVSSQCAFLQVACVLPIVGFFATRTEGVDMHWTAQGWS